MMFYNNGSYSAGDVVPEKPDQHNAIYNTGSRSTGTLTGSAGCYIKIEPNQQEILY